MLHKIIHFFCGVGIGILPIAVIFIFNPSSSGIANGLTGLLFCVPIMFVLRGKAKMFTLGFNTIWFVLSFILVVIGIIAGIRGQPEDLWVLGIAGLPGIPFFGIGYWIILKKAREVELRKIVSEDLTLRSNDEGDLNNKQEKEDSDE